jgi:predicted NUDIX family phosphoesterase
MTANSYVKLALIVLSSANRPLSAREIWMTAVGAAIVPAHLKGLTPHKTLHARLAEDIRRRGADSQFYRFSAGRFALRERATDESFDKRYKEEYLAPIRRKSISKNAALVISSSEVEHRTKNILDVDSNWLMRIFDRGEYFYLDRHIAEQTSEALQVVSYVAVCNRAQVLCYSRGSYSAAAADFLGDSSIGFGGHVEYMDASMFDTTHVGLYENAIRELNEELRISSVKLRESVSNGNLKIVGTLLDDTTAAGNKHLAVAFILEVRDDLAARKGELSINNLEWISLVPGSNRIQRMEAWSRYFFEFLSHGTR